LENCRFAAIAEAKVKSKDRQWLAVVPNDPSGAGSSFE